MSIAILLSALAMLAACGSQQAHSPPRIPDADRDGVSDGADLCPEFPEQINGLDDDDGCPDRPRECVDTGPVVLNDYFNFQRNTTALVRDETPVLDALAITLDYNSEAERIEVRGNATTDERRASPELALARANLIREELIRRGIAAQRLVALALPAPCPVDGKASIGRVDLRIAVWNGVERRYESDCKRWEPPCAWLPGPPSSAIAAVDALVPALVVRSRLRSAERN